MQTITTPAWTITLPADWHELKDQDSGMHFESADGEKALYIATWTMAAGSTRAARGLADDFLAYDLEQLAAMEDHAWSTLAQHVHCEGGQCVAVADSVDQQAQYRIISRILARDGQVVRASLHDYACIDVAASRVYFEPILASLALVADK